MFAKLENDTEGFWNGEMLASAEEGGCRGKSRHLVMKDRTTPAQLLHTAPGEAARCH